MRIGYWSVLVAQYMHDRDNPGMPPDYDKRWAWCEAQITAEYPCKFMRCMSVNYDSKTDRYVGTFYLDAERAKITVKLSNEVAVYLLANMRIIQDQREVIAAPYLKLDDKGCAVDCVLMVS